MRIPIGRLLARDPFTSLDELMQAVNDCCAFLPPMFAALAAGDQKQVVALAKGASAAEASADDVKDRLRDQLPRSLFLPVDRRDVLGLISQMDAVADSAEDVGVVLTLRQFTVPPELAAPLMALVEAVMHTVACASAVVDLLPDLVAGGFGGRSATRAREAIAAVSQAEHVADKRQDQAAKRLFTLEDQMSAVSLFMWTKVLQILGAIANHAENVGDRIRLFLAR
jgi:predicted phosphate transport protein (TIGR00153 family)